MGAASDLFHELTAHGLTLTMEGDNLMVSPRERLTDPLRARIREAKPDLLRLLAGDITMDPDPEPAPVATSRAWLMTMPGGLHLEVTSTPPCSLADLKVNYPHALVIEPCDPEEEGGIADQDHETTPATLPEVRAWYPGALGIEPQEDDAHEGEEPAPPAEFEPLPDDRITCRQCGHLTGVRCQVAQRGGFSHRARWYEPDPEARHACYLFTPLPHDPDQRAGAARWPSLEWMMRNST